MQFAAAVQAVDQVELQLGYSVSANDELLRNVYGFFHVLWIF